MTLPEDIQSDVASIFRERWDKMHSPLHSLGYMLEPQFQGTQFGQEVRLQLLASITLQASQYAYEVMVLQVRRDFRNVLKRLLPEKADYQAALGQYTKYSNMEGIFGDEAIMSLTQDDSPNLIPTYQFWAEYGQCPPLQRVVYCHMHAIPWPCACSSCFSSAAIRIA